MIASVLIVNYNSGRRLADCLASLESQTVPPGQFEVIVLDNASTDGSFESAAARFPGARYIRSRHNIGFAEGNNLAAKFANADTLVLLNPDTVADPFWLEELLAIMQETGATAAASKLVFADDPALINSAGLQLLRDGRGADLGFRQRDVGQFEQTREVFAGCGAALAIKRGHFEFDGSLFLYCEDLDAGWKRQVRGEATVYAPRSLVRHAVGAAEHSPVHRFFSERNRVLTAIRHADLPLAIYCGLLLVLKVPRALLHWLTGSLPWRTAFAVPQALAAVIGNLPEAIVQRYLNRCWSAR